MKKHILAISCAVALAGCSSQVVDNSPIVNGAVLKAEYSINGQIIPNFTGKQNVHTIAAKRSIRNANKFDNIMMRWANSDKAMIARIGLNKRYEVNYKSENYSECSLSGCDSLSYLEQFKSQGESESEDDYQGYEELGCSVEMVNNDFAVTRTGNTRKINGFDVEQYTVMWTVEYQDKIGKKDFNQVSFDFWTTDTNASMNQAHRVHGQFQDGYYRSVSKNPLMQLIGEDGYKALAAFTGDMDNQKNQFNGEIGRKLATIKGYPISIKFEWVKKSEACAEQKSADDGLEMSTDLKDMGKQLLSNLMKKGKEKLVDDWKKKPLVRYVYEIKSIKMQDFHDSVFEPPVDFKLVNRK